MFASVYPAPYIDILKLIGKDWSKAELSGVVEEAIDPAIGKKVFRVGGTTSATNYLAPPKAWVPGGLG